MKAIAVLLLVVCLALPAAAQESTPEATPESTPEVTASPATPLRGLFTAPGIYSISQPFNGIERSYLLAIPEAYFEGDEPLPLIIVLHGATGTGERMVGITGFAELGESARFVSVYPDGLNGAWNDGRERDARIDATLDDLSYLNGLIDTLIEALNIDPARVYVTGYSMGGFMSMRLACRIPERIAAVASVAGTMPQYILDECGGSTPVPFLLVQGTNDVIVPWLGVLTRSGSGYLSALDTVDFWANRNGCQPPARIEDFPDLDPDDDTRVLIETYEDCTDGAEVGLIGIYRGGHTWPGHPFQGFSQLGLTSMDIDATSVIWAFFARHQR